MGRRIYCRAMIALSVRQPYAEQILRGVKRFEYRSRPTRHRGRVLIYASKTLEPGTERDEFVRGRLVGTVEIIGCEWSDDDDCYRWQLSLPRRLRPRRPRNHPQPVWFYPF